MVQKGVIIESPHEEPRRGFGYKHIVPSKTLLNYWLFVQYFGLLCVLKKRKVYICN